MRLLVRRVCLSGFANFAHPCIPQKPHFQFANETNFADGRSKAMAAAGDDASKAEHRRLFSEKMMNKLSDMRDQTERSQFLSEEKFGEITECVEKWPTLTPQERKESQWTQGYAWAKKYSVIIVGESKVLVFNEKEAGKATDDGAQLPPLQPALDQATQVTHQGKVFEDLLAVHVSGGHCKAKAFRDGVKKTFGKSVPQ